MSNTKAPITLQTFDLSKFFTSPGENNCPQLVNTAHFVRTRTQLSDNTSVISETFPDTPGLCCAFFRVSPSEDQTARFALDGEYELISSASGGWVLRSLNSSLSSYWIPRAPVVRLSDKNERILEIAKLLSGDKITEASMISAREMIGTV
jgi:hypothetical protein